MSKIDPQLRHDFINNSLRLEVLSKLICKDLEQDNKPNDQYVGDFEKFLNVTKSSGRAHTILWSGRSWHVATWMKQISEGFGLFGHLWLDYQK